METKERYKHGNGGIVDRSKVLAQVNSLIQFTLIANTHACEHIYIYTAYACFEVNEYYLQLIITWIIY